MTRTLKLIDSCPKCSSPLDLTSTAFSIHKHTVKMQLSEETKVGHLQRRVCTQANTCTQERIGRLIDLSKTAIHYGYLPLILYLGYSYSNPRPTLIKYALIYCAILEPC